MVKRQCNECYKLVKQLKKPTKKLGKAITKEVAEIFNFETKDAEKNFEHSRV